MCIRDSGVTGVAATGAVGSTTVSIDIPVDVTGVSATGSAGSAFVWGNIVPGQSTDWTGVSPSQSTTWTEIAA